MKPVSLCLFLAWRERGRGKFVWRKLKAHLLPSSSMESRDSDSSPAVSLHSVAKQRLKETPRISDSRVEAHFPFPARSTIQGKLLPGNQLLILFSLHPYHQSQITISYTTHPNILKDFLCFSNKILISSDYFYLVFDKLRN